MPMYYDKLKRRVSDVVKARRLARSDHVDIKDCIAKCYFPVHEDIKERKHSVYHLPGGRGSGKSSFISLEIVDGIMQDKDANGIVFRRYANTMRDSVFTQIAWAIDKLGVSHLWRGNVSPMVYTYLPTGQQIVFRGLDDSLKLKSIKPRHGAFKYVWFEEFCELNGPNQVRSVLQSVIRGGEGFRVFNSFNPPLSINSWANKYVIQPDDRALLYRTDYTMIPPEWLGESFLLEAERLRDVNEKAYRHEYMGESTGTGGEVFPNIIAREITDDEIAEMQYIHCGIDWGFASDPLAFIRCSYDRRTQTVFLLDEIVRRGISNAAIAGEIKERGYDKSGEYYYSFFDHKQIQDEQLIICDSAEPKSIYDLCNLDLKAVKCKKYPGSVQYGIRWLQTKHIVIDQRRTPHAYDEFTEYEYESTRDGEFLASVPDRNNHCIDAVRYSLDHIINDSENSA